MMVVPFVTWTMSIRAFGVFVPMPSLPVWVTVMPVEPATLSPPAKVEVADASVAM